MSPPLRRHTDKDISPSTFESLESWQGGGDAVEVALGDEGGFLGSTWGFKGAPFQGPLAVGADRVTGPAVSEDCGDVTAAEHRGAVLGDDGAHAVPVEIEHL